MTDLLEALADGASQSDLTGEPQTVVLQRIRDLRIGALRLPVDEGGAGWSLLDLFELVVTMARADPNVTHVLRNHFAFVEAQLALEPGPVRDRWLGRVAAGDLFGNASGEATISIGSKQFGTALVEDGDGFRLTGEKKYCTGTPFSDWVTVLAMGTRGGTVTLVIPTDRAGVICLDDWDGMGQRLSGTVTVRFEDVAIAADEVLEARSSGSGPAGVHSAVGSFFQLYLTSIVAGIVAAAADDAAIILRERGRTFTHAPTERAPDDPHLLAMVGELASAAFSARATVLAAVPALADALDSRVEGVPDQALAELAAVHAAQAKIVVDDLAVAVGGRVFDVAGASATRRPVNLDRHWRNARTLASHNPRVYKAQAIGDLLVNATPLPTNGYF